MLLTGNFRPKVAVLTPAMAHTVDDARGELPHVPCIASGGETSLRRKVPEYDTDFYPFRG